MTGRTLRLIVVCSALVAVGCSGAQKNYARYTARCNRTKSDDDCYRQGVYAARSNHLEDAKETLGRLCFKGHEASCRAYASKFPNEPLNKLGSDRLNTTEVLSAHEAEEYLSRNIHWRIDSDPRGAVINYRVNSSTREVSSTSEIYLERTPYEAVRRFDIKGLTADNMKFVSIILEVSKKGYYTQRKEFQISSAMQQGEIGMLFELEKNRDAE